jgi:plasmid stabilization system protein ParE
VKVVVARVAQAELNAAVRWYEDRRDGLGWEFFDEYARCGELISKRPRVFAAEEDIPPGQEVRSLMMERFPYRLIYRIESDRILVIAVAHAARQPGYWRDRLELEEE